MEKITLVSSRTIKGRYGCGAQQAIIDHSRYGRILITEQWGGGNLQGEQYRFSHGLAAKLHDDDTFDALDAPWNKWTSTIDAVLGAHDNSRPIFEWPGKVLVSIAKKAGVAAS